MDVWDPSLWLPRNISWDQVPAKTEDLIYPFYFALPFVFFRILWEGLVGIPASHLCGYNSGPLIPNALQHIFGGFTRNTRQKRILECFWRFSFYTFSWIYGLYVLWDKSWFWDVKNCWIDYPFHPIDQSIWWYYMLETSFYYSLLLGAFFDVRRSDFWELMTHHFVTIGLLSVSWTINFVRVGTLVLVSHDVSDIFLEGGKLVRYSGVHKTLTNICFVFFMSSWILTRLTYYPFVVIRSAIFEAANLIQPDYELYNPFQVPYVPRLIILLLAALLVLHIFWTVIIGRIVARTITEGEAADVRSDDEDEEEEQKVRQLRAAKTRTRKAD
ncbi:unnamed protein product, partial [Mesorhabditis belari]|uniref:TLC domain-containing protein n=1 Tax=Mesorhabditis belari TaxID=2138241 RepID=A0AAF3EZA1_9BILA